jgi:ligand-binding sensor domain-containing protein
VSMLVHPRRLALSIALLLLVGTALGLLRFKRSVDRTLISSRQEVIDQHSVYLKSRVIIPQARAGFSLLPATLAASSGVFHQDHLFVASNLGLLQFDQSGREVRRYSALDGLPCNHLTALASTPDALWIGVGPQGLLRFTGAQFEYFYAEKASDFEVTALLALPSGELWIGTKQRGLLVFQGNRAVEFAPAISSRFITALQGDHRQAVVGTFDDGAWVYRQGILSQFKKAAGDSGGLLDDQVTSVAGNLEAVYVGTPLGVTEIQNGKPSGYFAKGLTIRSLTAGAKPVAATDRGLVRLNPRAKLRLESVHPDSAQIDSQSFSRPSEAPSGINGLLPISNGWLALTDNGVYSTDSLERGPWKRFGIDSSDGLHGSINVAEPFQLSDTNISALAFDQNSNLWVGYFDRGLDVFDSQGKRLIHHEDDHIFCVNHVLALRDGRMAVSTANGLAIYYGTRRQHFITEKQGLIHRAVAMTHSLGGTTERWLAGTAEGVSLFEGNRPTQNLFALHGLANNHVYCAGSLGKRVYLGTLGGISVLEEGRIVFSWNTANSGLAANWVNALAVLGPKLFVGTYGGGVQSVEGDGQWTDYRDLIGQFEVNPNAMAVDGERLYAGTLDRGIQIYNGSQGRWQVVQEGLPSQNVTAFAFTSDHVLAGTDRGVVEIRKDAF